MLPRIQWPGGKQFAFTIFDDPDLDTVDNSTLMYSFLGELGLRTTKAVWPVRGNGMPKFGGVTCEDQEYLRFVTDLQKRGFEIALHNVTYHTSCRQDTARGLDRFYELFGHHPYSMANHSGCDESIYWGSSRLSGVQRALYNVLHLGRRKPRHYGHVESSPLFWGDLCRERVRYVRNFTYGDINTLKKCPYMPYNDPDRPYVNNWFAASEGRGIRSFTALLSEANQDKLLQESGACIMYAHLAFGFVEKGKLNPEFVRLMRRLSLMNGWFVPVTELLDYVAAQKGACTISRRQRGELERSWLWHKVVHTHGRS